MQLMRAFYKKVHPGCPARKLFNARCDHSVGTETYDLELKGLLMRLAVIYTVVVCFHVDYGCCIKRYVLRPDAS